jgi:hypothetical protein
MRERLRQISRRVALKGGMLAGGATAVGVSVVAWLVEACGGGTSSGGYGYGDPYGYGFGWRSRSSRERFAARQGARRILGG